MNKSDTKKQKIKKPRKNIFNIAGCIMWVQWLENGHFPIFLSGTSLILYSVSQDLLSIVISDKKKKETS